MGWVISLVMRVSRCTSSSRPVYDDIGMLNINIFMVSIKKCLKVRQALGTCKVSSLSSVPSAYVDPWDILNNFCFHVYAQKLILFIGENGNEFCFASSPYPVTLEFIELVPS